MTLSDTVIAIVGMGLMGGSLGKRLVQSGACKEVRGLVRRSEAVETVLNWGAADTADTEPSRVLPGANMVVIATPVKTIESQIVTLHEFMDDRAVLTDMGSVKSGIVKAMQSLPPRIVPVGGHPMCGKEISGIEAADPELFQDKVWVIVPLERSDPEAIRLIKETIRAVGARETVMSPEIHDMAAATISHLPYMLAATLVAVADEIAAERPEVWQLAAGGFRDTSRVAAGNIEMMMDILSSNKENVLRMLNLAGRRIEEFSELLKNKTDEGLRRKLSQIQIVRKTYHTLGTE